MEGTIHADGLNAIAYDDSSGTLYACGYTAGNFSEPLDADPAPASKNLDVVVLAFNTLTQELLWRKVFTSGPDVDRDDEAHAITFDRSGMLHVSGKTRGKGAYYCIEGFLPYSSPLAGDVPSHEPKTQY